MLTEKQQKEAKKNRLEFYQQNIHSKQFKSSMKHWVMVSFRMAKLIPKTKTSFKSIGRNNTNGSNGSLFGAHYFLHRTMAKSNIDWCIGLAYYILTQCALYYTAYEIFCSVHLYLWEEENPLIANVLSRFRHSISTYMKMSNVRRFWLLKFFTTKQ